MRMARSTYYFEINKVDVVKSKNAKLMSEIQEIFDYNKGRGGSAKDSGIKTDAISVDFLTERYGRFTYLNVDVEGAEKELLQGAENTLKQHKPKTCMAVYHRSEDIFDLINRIKDINPDYKIFLRHHPHISFWDTNIYCI